MRKLSFSLLFAFVFSLSYAQNAESDFSKISTDLELELPEIQTSMSLKDSIRSVFKVNKESELIDSLWRKELYNSDLFDEMYADITSFDVDEEVEYKELSTEVLKKRLELLNARTPFVVEYNESLESVIKSYLKNRRKSLQRLMNLSNYYFPMFEQELDKYNLPLEIKYLAIVESALNPRARSRVGATGLWQFMFPTGKMFGMDVSSYVDERSDPLRATEAACKYLSSLHNVFNDWDLALAAYNSGPGNVSKAIRRSGGEKNYWKIRHNLPRETAGYVPAFLATMYIFEYAEEHGFKKNKIDRAYYETDTIHIKQTLTFNQISDLLDLPVEELQFLNPSYKLDVIPFVEGKNYTLRLPVDVLGTFVSNEDLVYAYINEQAKTDEKPLQQINNQNNQITYRVKSGDFLGKIARDHNVTVNNIKQWNNLKSNTLKVGQRLNLFQTSSNSNTSIAQTNPTKTDLREYTVKPGDTLWSIAQKFPGVSIDNIKKWNDISGTVLKPGMKLKVNNG
ncbi:MAG: LysM peptidoglycan-binding domain-containing protein [Flavobacteriales bacterium]|nr:LysM peptidoglycan-binding domain-containing protein [Flavobacteriales bacterium]